jgi:hypothetical protein
MGGTRSQAGFEVVFPLSWKNAASNIGTANAIKNLRDPAEKEKPKLASKKIAMDGSNKPVS